MESLVQNMRLFIFIFRKSVGGRNVKSGKNKISRIINSEFKSVFEIFKKTKTFPIVLITPPDVFTSITTDSRQWRLRSRGPAVITATKKRTRKRSLKAPLATVFVSTCPICIRHFHREDTSWWKIRRPVVALGLINDRTRL